MASKEYVELLLNKLKGSDPPSDIEDTDDEE